LLKYMLFRAKRNQSTSVVIIAQNLLPKSYGVCCLVLDSKPPTLNLVARGRMAFVKALTAPFEVAFWMEGSSTVLKRTRSL